MYSFLHADFDSVKIYSTRLYVHLTKEGKEEDFFVTSAEKEDDEFLPVLELPLLVEQRVCAVEILNLPCLASGHNLNLTSEEMADLWRQGIAVDDNNGPAPENIPTPKNKFLNTTAIGL